MGNNICTSTKIQEIITHPNTDHQLEEEKLGKNICIKTRKTKTKTIIMIEKNPSSLYGSPFNLQHDFNGFHTPMNVEQIIIRN